MWHLCETLGDPEPDHFRGVPEIRLRRLDRIHHQDHPRLETRNPLAGRYRTESRQPAARRMQGRWQVRALYVSDRVYVFHHVSYRSAALVVDAGEPARREPGESDQGTGKRSATGQGCAGADVERIALIVSGDRQALFLHF